MTITLAARFRGPSRSGNGGYTAGLLADAVGAPVVTVTLRRPPPLDTALELTADGDETHLSDAGTPVATARPGELTLQPAPPVAYDVAVEAAKSYPGFAEHPFPGCFTCGPDRAVGDGLRLFPGPVAGMDGTVATPWIPDPGFGTVSTPLVWAALDCPGGWSLDLVGRAMVLGRMTATVLAAPRLGEECVVVGRNHGVDGRKGFTSSALYAGDGRLLARAEAIWIAVDPAVINALA